MRHCRPPSTICHLVLALRASRRIAKLSDIASPNVYAPRKTQRIFWRLLFFNLILENHIGLPRLVQAPRQHSHICNVCRLPLLSIGDAQHRPRISNRGRITIKEDMLSMFPFSPKIDGFSPTFAPMKWFMTPRLVPARFAKSQKFAIEWPPTNSVIRRSPILALA